MEGLEEFEIIDAYTREDALEEGFITNIGKIDELEIDATMGVIEHQNRLLLPKAIIKVVDLMTKRELRTFNRMEIDGQSIIVTAGFDEKGNRVITIMLPEEY